MILPLLEMSKAEGNMNIRLSLDFSYPPKMLLRVIGMGDNSPTLLLYSLGGVPYLFKDLDKIESLASTQKRISVSNQDEIC